MSTSKNIKSNNGKGGRQSTKGNSGAKNDYSQLITGFLILVVILGGLWFFISNQSQGLGENQEGVGKDTSSSSSTKKDSGVTISKISVNPNGLKVNERKINVELNKPVETDTTIKLTTEPPELLTFKTVAVVKKRERSVTIEATVASVKVLSRVTLLVTLDGNTKRQEFDIKPPTLQTQTLSLSMTPSKIRPGGTSTGRLSLDSVVDSTVTIALTSNNTAVAVPATVEIKAGEKTAQFDATATENAAKSEIKITAMMGTVSGFTSLEITESAQPVTESWVIPVLVITCILACSSFVFSLFLYFSKPRTSENLVSGDYEALQKSQSDLSRNLDFKIRRVDEELVKTKSDLGRVVGDIAQLRKLVNDLESNLSTSIGRLDRKISGLEQSQSTGVPTIPTPIPVPDLPHPPINRLPLSVEEQTVLDYIELELTQTTVLIGKVMKATNHWCLFSEHLKSEIRTKIGLHGYVIIEPKAGDKFDSTTMEYESLPYNAKFLVRQVEMLGVRDPGSSGLLRAMVVVE